MTMSSPTTCELVRPSLEDPVQRVLGLLTRALQIVDDENLPPEIGARLDHVICSLQELKA